MPPRLSVPLLVKVVPVPTARVVPVPWIVRDDPLSIVSLPALLAVRVTLPTVVSVTEEDIKVTVPGYC